MSALLPSTSRAATIGYRAVRYYAAAALQPTPESRPSPAQSSPLPSSEAGPSRQRSTPPPSQSQSLPKPHPLSIPLPPSSESSIADQLPRARKAPFVKPIRSNPARQSAVRKAQAFAKALRAETAASNTVQSSLSSIQPSPEASSPIEEPSLADLLAKRPPSRRIATHNTKYPALYNQAYSAIDIAFTQRQLVKLVREMGLKAGIKQPKLRLVPKLLSHWDWDPPVSPEPLSTVKHANTTDFDMEAADVFLLISNDPAFRRMMGDKYPPTFSILAAPVAERSTTTGATPSPSRAILRVAGTERHLIDLANVINTRQSSKLVMLVDIKEELGGHRPEPSLLNALPFQYGSYVEELGPGVLRLSSTSDFRNKRAYRILLQAAARRKPQLSNHFTATVLPAHSSSGSQSSTALGDFTLSPFYPSSMRQLPWDVAAATGNASMARLRRTILWEAKPSRAGETQRLERIEHAKVWRGHSEHKSAIDESLGELTNDFIKTVEHDAAEGAQTSMVLEFGHLLRAVQDPLTTSIYDGNPLASSQEIVPLHPPVESTHFVPSATPCMLQFPLTAPSKKFRRIRYRCMESGTEIVPNRQVVFNWAYPISPVAPVALEIDEQQEWQDELDAMMKKAEADVLVDEAPTKQSQKAIEQLDSELEDPAEGDVAEGAEAGGDSEEATGSNVPGLTAEIHTLATANLRLPDRPIDARLAVRSAVPLNTRGRLHGIRQFIRNLEQRELCLDSPVTRFLPPKRITYTIGGQRHRFALLSDEDCDITEADRGGGVILRTIKSVEVSVAWSQPITHTELEYRGGAPPDEFWKSFAEISREVPANAGALQREIPSY